MKYLNIKNSAFLIKRFGKWPSFHDAEITSLNLESTEYGADLFLKIKYFNMTNRTDEKGYFICDKHSVLIFKFTNIVDLELYDFIHQNVLQSLDIQEIADSGKGGSKYTVTLYSSYGLNGGFKCEKIEVIDSIDKP